MRILAVWDDETEAEQISLLLPVHRQVRQATHSVCSQLDGLTPFQDGLRNVRCQIGKPQSTANLVLVDPLFCRKIDN